MKEVILTPEGYEKLKQEIELLSTEKRREVADRIRVAREFGDITENAEYDDAKNEQAMLEHKIAQLEERLFERARDPEARRRPERRLDRRQGEAARRRREADGRVLHRRLGRGESRRVKLSNESPVGKAIIGKKKGETVEVAAPRGSLKYKILDIKAA